MGFDAVEITNNRALEVWWCLLWRTLVGFLLVILFVKAVVTTIAICLSILFGGMSGEIAKRIEIPFNVLGTVLLIYVSFLVVRFIFKKRFSDFELVLVARDNQKPKELETPNSE